jgi:hypothetical protein
VIVQLRFDKLKNIEFVLMYLSVQKVFMKKETYVNFLTELLDERSTLRPANVLVYGWVGGKHACVDLTEVSLLVVLWNWRLEILLEITT